jgi:hypothetical protein
MPGSIQKRMHSVAVFHGSMTVMPWTWLEQPDQSLKVGVEKVKIHLEFFLGFFENPF